MPNLSGKTALVTGASRGIGRASALALAAAGAQVLVHYGRGATEDDNVVAEIRKAGGRADAVAADLAAADGPHKLAKLVRNIVGDRLDILGGKKDIYGKQQGIATTYGESWQIALPAGDYVVQVTKTDGSEKTAPVSIKAGERTELTVE